MNSPDGEACNFTPDLLVVVRRRQNVNGPNGSTPTKVKGGFEGMASYLEPLRAEPKLTYLIIFHSVIG